VEKQEIHSNFHRRVISIFTEQKEVSIMTILPPEETFLDKVLRRFRKEREVLPPLNMRGILKKFAPYVIVIGKRKSFWKTLFKRRIKVKPDFHNNG